jgi:hypothetical protein
MITITLTPTLIMIIMTCMSVIAYTHCCRTSCVPVMWMVSILARLRTALFSTNHDSVYTHTWLDAQKAAFPDFSMNHKCRDFDTVLRWHDLNSVPLEKFGAIRRPADFEPHIMVSAMLDFARVRRMAADLPRRTMISRPSSSGMTNTQMTEISVTRLAETSR